MTFSDMVGQERIKSLLENSIKSDRIAGCYIIEGTEGMGKRTLAGIFAGYLMCEMGTACGKCKGCTLYGAGNHPDVLIVQKDSKKKVLDVESLKAQVMEFAYVKPYMSRRKVIIIPEYGGIGAASQNALLKIIEEPPQYLTFMILVADSAALLDTVRSRSVILTLEDYTKQQVRRALGIFNEYEHEHLISYAENNIGKVKKLTEDEGFAEKRAKVFDTVACLFSKRRSDVFLLTDLIEENKDDAQMIFDIILGFFRDIILIKTGNEKLVLNGDYKQKLFDAEHITTLGKCYKASNVVLRAKDNLSRNVNFSLLTTVFANDCWEVLK